MSVNEPAQLRVVFFVAILFLVAIMEFAAPRRRLTVSRAGRWFNNLALIGMDALLVHVFFPVAAVGVAVAAQKNDWGLFNLLDLPVWLSILSTVLILDLIVYLQHVLFHAVPALWRLHMVHHADLDIDVTTGLRFHPLEIAASMLIKMVSVAALGPPVTAVLIFEIALNATAMFNHGNMFLPGKTDRFLRLLVVTPDMHRVHHSVIIRETNSNFGFNFPWWDRLLGTYRDQPAEGHAGMTIGLSHLRKVEQVSLLRLLFLPFFGKAGQYPLTAHGKDPAGSSRQKQSSG